MKSVDNFRHLCYYVCKLIPQKENEKMVKLKRLLTVFLVMTIAIGFMGFQVNATQQIEKTSKEIFTSQDIKKSYNQIIPETLNVILSNPQEFGFTNRNNFV